MSGEKSLLSYQHSHRNQPMNAHNPPSRIGRAARSFQGEEGMEPRPMERVCFAAIIVATLMLHGFEPPPCRAQSPAPPPSSLPPAPPRSSLPPAQPHPPIPPPRPAREFEAVKLKQAPLEATDLPLPINLATALRLSDARPLIVAAAQASVWVAEAQLTRAKVLWVPQLNLGFDYIRHDGGGPDFNKGIMTAPSVNFFYGGVGMVQSGATTDMIYMPLAARQIPPPAGTENARNCREGRVHPSSPA